MRVTPQKVLLGQPFEVEVVLTHPSSQRYDLSAAPAEEAFDVVAQERSRSDGASESTTTFRVKLAAFQLGALKTPTLTFDVLDGTTQGRQQVEGVAVEVASSLPPDAQEQGASMLDIRPPREVPIPSYRLLWALAAALLTAALAWLLFRWLKRPRAPKPVPAVPALPLDVRTRAALDALRQEDLPGQGRVREFYFRLSEVVRGYLGERYGFEALESTTPELLAAVRRLHTPGLPLADLERFAYSSDFARYAKAVPSLDDCKGALEFGYRLVEVTSLQGPPPNHAAPARAP